MGASANGVQVLTRLQQSLLFGDIYNEWNEQCCLAAELPRSRCLESLGGENSKRALLPHPRIEGTLVLLTPWVSGLVPHVYGWKVWSQCKVLRKTKPIL